MKPNKQSGQALVGAAIAMVVLCGFAGLAIDMGTLRYQKRVQQTAADSAAIAGAQNLDFGFGATTGAQNASTQNGFTDSGGSALSNCDGAAAIGTICVQVNNPPADVSFGGGTISAGAHPGNSAYVEVLVAEVQPTYFMTIFGVNSKAVVARAVATNVKGGTDTSCLYTLGPPTNAIVGIDPTGNAKIIGPNCGISDNGNLDTTGNSYTVEASQISVAGQCLGSHCGVYPDTQCWYYPGHICPTLGGAPGTQDPMTVMQPPLVAPSQPPAASNCPSTGLCDITSPANNTTPYVLNPGTYNSITIGKNSVVTMNPGIYYINGASAPNAGLNFSGGGTVSGGSQGGDGVMIYFTNGSTINKAAGGGNNPDMNLYPLAPDQSTMYAGLLFYQDPTDTAAPWIGGDNNSTYNGTVYMPTATLNFYGNGTETFNGTLIAYSIATTGSPIVNLNQALPGVPIPAYLTQPVLVE